MNPNVRRVTTRSWPVVFAVVLAAAAAYAAKSGVSAGEPGAGGGAQDLSRLENRMNTLEQRLYSIDASINRLEQQSRLSGVTPSAGAGARDVEVRLLRAEVEVLQRRLVESECALVRLDERTLAPAAREARRQAGVGRPDPCRLNPEAPVRLVARP